MTRLCPHCGVLAHFTEVWSDNTNDGIVLLLYAGKLSLRKCWLCDNCFMPVCGMSQINDAAVLGPLIVWPETVTCRTYDDVPEAIAGAASEAHQALGAKAPRAAVAMARAVIEATARDKEITGKDLKTMIDNLALAGHISEAMWEAAHEIRFAGNEAAHGDNLSESISVEEATEIVDLMDAILERVYQEPAKVARVRASREARQNAKVAAQSGAQAVTSP